MKTNITLQSLTMCQESTIQAIAKSILTQGLQAQFNEYLAAYIGESILDVYDCLQDFSTHGAKIELVSSSGATLATFFGMNPAHTMQQLNDYLWSQIDHTPRNWQAVGQNSKRWDELEQCTFTLGGVARPVVLTYFHYCFAKGRITVNELLSYSVEPVAC